MADVANEEQVRQSVETIVGRFQSLSIVVNCAGIVHAKLLHEYSSANWDLLMAVNVKSIFFSFKHAWPLSSLRNGAMELAGVTGAALGGAVLEATSFGRLFGVAGAVGACAGAALWIVLRAWSRRTP
jgi:NAD(P)-dependent dehydrogenase (short-subunit alcohol dehydrogenase family)